MDFLLTKERDEQDAKRFLTKAIRRHGVPEKITIDGSAANEAAIKSYNEEHGTAITIRKIKYLNNIVEICDKTHVLFAAPLVVLHAVIQSSLHRGCFFKLIKLANNR